MIIKLKTEKIQGKDMALSTLGRILLIFISFYLYLYGKHAVFDRARLFQDFHDLAACSAIILSALVVVCICFIMNYVFKVVQILFENAQDLSKIALVILLMIIPIGEIAYIFNHNVKGATVFSYWQDKISDAFIDSSYLWHHAYRPDDVNQYIIKELCEAISEDPGFSASYNKDNSIILINCKGGASYLIGVKEMGVCLFRNPPELNSFDDLPEGWSIHTPLTSQTAVREISFKNTDNIPRVKRLIIAAINDMEVFLNENK